MFKDKKAREVIEMLRREVGYTKTNWSCQFPQPDESKLVWSKLKVVETKLDLILDHLNLQYVPETTKNEPAKLVEKVEKEWSMSDCLRQISERAACHYLTNKEQPPKKKRGRPKKK